MPSPFPGMDPYLEMTSWTDFQVNLAVELSRRLVPNALPTYVPFVKSRTYIETEFPDPSIVFDVMPSKRKAAAMASSGGTAILEPAAYVAASPDGRFEPFVEIRGRESNDVVTVIEILSPMNKRKGSDGRRKYLEEWHESLEKPINVVEIDLLRGGERSPTTRPLNATTDYCVMIHRHKRRPVVDVFEWPLAHRLPTIPIPLARDHADAPLDLQSVFETIYEGAGYAYYLPYHKQLIPQPRPHDPVWIENCLSTWRQAK